MTRTTIKQTLIDHGVTEVSGALLDRLTTLTASGNDVLREIRAELERGVRRADDSRNMRISIFRTTIAAVVARIDAALREAAASRLCPECEGEGVAEMIGGWPRPCDACQGTGSLPLTKEPTP